MKIFHYKRQNISAFYLSGIVRLRKIYKGSIKFEVALRKLQSIDQSNDFFDGILESLFAVKNSVCVVPNTCHNMIVCNCLIFCQFLLNVFLNSRFELFHNLMK